MKIFLTGGSGFIGRNFLEVLGGQYDISAPSHAELDLLDAAAIKRFLGKGNFDVVVHAASVGGNRRQAGLAHVYEVNRRMFLNLAEQDKDFERLIFLGSGAEYGKQADIKIVREENFGKRQPGDEYGKSKYFASEYIGRRKNMLNLRCFGVFGKYEDYKTRLISKSICRALFGLPIVVNQNAKFDYVYAPDLIGIIDYFINNKPREKFYNVGAGSSTELLELARMVKDATGGGVEIKIKREGMAREYTCDNGRLRAEVAGLKFTPHSEAIGKLMEYYRGIISGIKREDLAFD